VRKLRFAAMLCVFLGASLAQETGWSQAQTEVWGREEAFWQSLKSRDKEVYRSLWDEAFLGWPSSWRKKDGEWRIVGGMSCNVSPDGTC